MTDNEPESYLVVSLERETEAGSDIYTARDTFTHIRNGGEIVSSKNAFHSFGELGNNVVFTNHYDEGMFDNPRVTCVIEVDDVSLEKPVVIGRIEEPFASPKIETLVLASTDKPWTDVIQSEFKPGQIVNYELGKTPDGKAVRVKFHDVRPTIPQDIPRPARV